MTREENFIHAAQLCRDAAGILDVVSAGVAQAKCQTLQIEAETALYEAIDLIWSAKETARERFIRVAAEILALQDERTAA